MAAVEFGQLYRRAASDLNQAQTFVAGDATVRYLNDLVARAYLAVYSRTRVRPWAAVVFWWNEYPAVFRRHLGLFISMRKSAGATKRMAEFPTLIEAAC